MGTPTYIPIANTTIGATTSAITFSSIPATYRDLIIVFLGRSTSNVQAGIRFNNDSSGSNYSSQRLSANGTTLVAANTTDTYIVVAKSALGTTTSDLQMNIEIMDYSATDKHKAVLSKAGNAANGFDVIANRWASNSAINSVSIRTDANSWAIGTTVAIYGVVA